MVRAVGLIRAMGALLAAMLGFMVAIVTAEVSRPRLPEPPFPQITEAVLSRAFDRERPLATAIGMQRVDEREVNVAADPSGRAAVWSEEVDIPAGGCIGVIVGTRGYVRPRALAIQELEASRDMVAYMPEPLSAQHNVEGVATQVQWCERQAARRVIVAEFESIDSMVGSTHQRGLLRRALYRGTLGAAGGYAGLRRGGLSPDALAARELPDDAVRAAQPYVPSGAQPLGTPMRIDVGRALLVPAEAETFAALWQAAAGSDDVAVNPRIDFGPTWGTPWQRPDVAGVQNARVRLARGRALPAEHDPWHEVGYNLFHRTLAVIDPSRLGAPCVTVVLTRMRASQEATVARFPGGATPTAHENVVTDRVCGGAPVGYSTRDDDGEPWLLRLFAG